MNLDVGTKKGASRIPNRKRVQASGGPKPARPSIQKPDLPVPVYGANFDIQKEYAKAVEEQSVCPKISYKEKELLATKTFQQKQTLPEYEIVEIGYSVISHEELEKVAAFEVTNSEDSGLRSVNDPRGGTIEEGVPCPTCQLDNLNCPGHPGIIHLNSPIIHPSFVQETLDILTCVCNSCGGLLLPKDTIEEKGFFNLEGSKRLRAIAEASVGIPCRRNFKDQENISPCIPNPIYILNKTKDTGYVFYTREGKKSAKEMGRRVKAADGNDDDYDDEKEFQKIKDNIKSTEDVEAILNAISEEDAAILGFSGASKPSRFIMKSIAVIPLCSRPPVFQDGEVMMDDLTSIYKDIVRANNALINKGLEESKRKKSRKNLIFYIEHLINNSDKKCKQGKQKVYQTIKDRIQGKNAIIRESIQGKRVNYSARTVLSPDPTLELGQIRVPRLMAPYLTQLETVTPETIEKLTQLLRAGKITFIIPSDGALIGKRVKVNEKLKNEHCLVVGDQVERWLQDGDYAVFNRQPTLHKQGFMGHSVVLGSQSTIGVHLAETRAYNAD